VYHFNNFSYWHIAGFIFIAATTLFCYSSIVGLAKCFYDESGELTYGGADLSMSGLCEYYFDITYINWFVLTGSMLSDWFWLFWLLIPTYIIYKLWDSVLKPFFFSPTPVDLPEDAASKKKREKAERKANKPKFMKMKR